MLKKLRPYLAWGAVALCLTLGIFLLPPPPGVHAQTQVNTIGGLTCQSNTQFGGPVMTWVLHELFVCPADSQTWTPVLLKNNAQFGYTGMAMCHAQYSFANDGGAVGLITPLNNCTMAANSIIYNASIQATTAATSGGSATVTVGMSGITGGTAILLGSTAVASVTGQLQSAIVPQTASGWKKLTSNGNVTITVGTAALTAGIIEVYVFFLTSST